MADHPAGKQTTTVDRPSALVVVDRTSRLVAGGLVVLAVLGVVTVFSDAIAAAWSPNAPAGATPSASTTAAAPIVSPPSPTAPASPAPSPATGPGGSP